MELLALSIGIGLVVGLLCSELFGLAAAGFVVPGYLALYLTDPRRLLATGAVAFATFGIVKLASAFLILHGRRRTALMILFGYLLGMLVSQWSGLWPGDFTTIGFIVPGLIALWMDKQGAAQTICALAVISVVVRLLLIVVGAELSS